MMTTGFRPRTRNTYRNCTPNGHMRSLNLTNIGESEKAYHIDIATPGWSKEEIKIESKDGHLTVVAQQKKAAENDIRFHKRQFVKKDFKRSFILPNDVNEDDINARFENGVLHITLERTVEVKNVKEISIS